MAETKLTQVEKKVTSETKSPGRAGRGRMLVGAFALGLMVSPDNLALLGRFAGHFNIYVPLLLVVGAVVYISYARSYENLYALFCLESGKALDIRKVLGVWLAYYPLTVRVLSAIFLTTGLTVTSGFVFNEVFVYWFPNFGFAYILLAVVSGLHFFGPDTRAKAQVLFVGTALVGLALLIGIGIVKGLPYTASHIPSGPRIMLSWLFVPLLFFIGFDIAVPFGAVSPHQTKDILQALKTAIAVFGVLMILWAIVTTQHVSGARLVATSISHMIAAREISGQFGRIIMGLVVIAGTCAAVNALFEAVARVTATMSKQKMLPRARYTSRFSVLCVAVAAAIMMAGGLAGEEILESYIRAALLLWLGGYGLLQIRLLQMTVAVTGMRQGSTRLRLLTTAVLAFGGAAILALTDDQAMIILKVMTTTIAIALVLGAIGNWRANKAPMLHKQHDKR
ncbi:MAG: hypothetical protein QNK29_04335 [Desulfobacterales bacterium]|nr:hypothetical protein [Desulfobacterales bacterium]MDX2511202.1 hypothetical protein [Desulfobacterales bacterium]